jgi:hypothetical protein
MMYVWFDRGCKKFHKKIRFPTHGVKDVFGIMYPKYWLQQNCDASLVMHLKVLKIDF